MIHSSTCKRVQTYKHPRLGMSIMGHFAFPPFCLSFSFAPSFHNLPPPSRPALSISLFLSVKVMQLIFLCLFIFQDWLWNVGSRQKPHQPLPSIPLLSSTRHLFPPSLLALALSKNPPTRESVEECPPPLLLPHPPLLPPLSLSLWSFYICSFHSSPLRSPFQLDIWPHSTNRIKVMHHT